MRLVLVVLGMNQVGSGNSLVEAIWWMKYLGNTQHLNNGLIGHKKDSSLLSKIYWLYRGYEFEPNRVVRSVVSWGEQWQTKLWPHTDSNLSYTIHTTVWKIRKKSHTHYRIRGFWIFPQKVREISNSPNPVASKL